MNPDDHDILWYESKLHDDLQPAFRSEMLRNLDEEDRARFVIKANLTHKLGLSKGLGISICNYRALQFLLWLTHQSLDVDLECGYCKFLDGVYDILDSFFSYPHKLHGKEVKTT